jgi:hypothetical protein
VIVSAAARVKPPGLAGVSGPGPTVRWRELDDELGAKDPRSVARIVGSAPAVSPVVHRGSRIPEHGSDPVRFDPALDPDEGSRASARLASWITRA